MNERCPLVIIPGMHHSPSGSQIFRKKKESLRTSALFYQFFRKTSSSSFERTGTSDSLIMGKKIQRTGTNSGTNHH